MAVNIKYRAPNPVVHTDTTIKNSPLSNEEIDGNFKNVKDAIEVIQSADGAAAVGFTPTGTVAATNVQSAINEVVSDLAAGTGASLVGYMPAGTGAVATTVQSKLQEVEAQTDYLPPLDLRYPGNTTNKGGLFLFEGDSLTEGSGGSNFRQYLLPMLRGIFGYGGPGYHGFNYNVSVDQGIGFNKSAGCQYIDISDGNYGRYAPGGFGIYTSGATGTDYFSWQTNGNYWTSARVFYLKQPGGGTFKIKTSDMNDSAATLVDTASATLDIGYIDVTYSYTASVALVVNAITGNVCVFGADFKLASSPNGVRFGMLAKGGRKLQEIAAQDAAFRQKWAAALAPSYYVLNAGMNDRSTRTAEQHLTDLTAVISAMSAGSASTSLWMVQSNEPGDAASTNFLSYVQKKVDVARTYKCGYHDERFALGRYSDASANGFMVDGVHPNAQGNKARAYALCRAIGLQTGGVDSGAIDWPGGGAGTVYVRSGSLSAKNGNLTLGSPTTLWTVGLTNGYPTAVFRLRVMAQRAATGATTTREFLFKISNSTTIGNATELTASPANTLLLKELAGDGNGIDFTLSVSIVSNKAVISVTPSGYSGYYFASCEYAFTYLTQAGQSVFES